MFLTLLLTFLIQVSANDAIGLLKSNPDRVIEATEYDILMPSSQQISCQHYNFRYKEMFKLLTEDMGWILDRKNDQPQFYSAIDYILDRSGVDVSHIADLPVLAITFDISQDQLAAWETEAIAVFHSMRYEQFLTESHVGLWSNVVKEVDKIVFNTKLNVIDICEKSYLDLMLLSGCEKDEAISEACEKNGICPAKYVANWVGCKNTKKIRVNFKYLQNILGKRNKILKRELL